MDTYSVQISEEGSKGRAFIGSSSDPAAEMTYSKAGTHLLIIDHTEVSEAHRGEGLGRKLLDKIVEMARDQELKIMPLCPYANSVFKKDASISDVLK